MKIVFFGTSNFAIPALRALLASGHKILAVVTQPDKKSGRNLKLSQPATKAMATSHDIPVYQPQDASSAESVSYFKKLEPDLFVVISFGQILRKDVLAVPKFYAINLHGSLLPKYRGAAPTNWAILSGEKRSGVTIIKMNERMDEGDIIMKQEAAIDEEDTNITLSEKLSELGAGVLLETIELIEKDKAVLAKQGAGEATYAPKLKKEDGLIDWNDSAVKIHNRVRGLIPWPGAYTRYNNKTLKVLETEVASSPTSGKAFKAGEIIEASPKSGIKVHAGGGDIILKYLQLEGKKEMDAPSFVRGHKIEKGYIFR